MKKTWLSLGVAAIAVGAVFGYDDSDKDAEGHAYNNPEYYVQLQKAPSGMEPFYNSSYTSYWSSDAIPAAGDKVYIPKAYSWTFKADSNFKTASGDVVFADSVTLAAWGAIKLYGNSAGDTSYRLFIHNLMLRPRSRMIAWWAMGSPAPFSFGGNAKTEGYNADDDVNCFVTITSEDGEKKTTGPTMIIPGKKNSPFIFHNGFVGDIYSVFLVQNFLEGTAASPSFSHADAAAANNYVAFLGNNEGYKGSVRVGSDIKVLLGEAGFPNGEIIVDGSNLLTPALKDDITHSSLGTVATSGEPVPVATLSLTNGATIACAGIVTNGVGFAASTGFNQQGAFNLDFENVPPTGTRLTILTVPASCSIDASKIEVLNQPVEGYTLKVETSDTTKSLVLVNEKMESYVCLVKDDAYDSSTGNRSGDPTKFAYFYETDSWSDSQAVHAGATYYVPNGMSVFVPVTWALVAAVRAAPYNRTNADSMKFLGDELIIGTGASFTPESYSASYNNKTYAPKIPVLTLEKGAQMFIAKGGAAIVNLDVGTLNIEGTEEDPSLIWYGTWWNSTGNYAAFNLANDFAGSGVVRVGGGAKAEIADLKPSQTNLFYGVNDAFTGKMYVGGFTSTRTKYSPVHGRIVMLFGASGLKNGTLIVDDPEVKLGATVASAASALIPFKSLTLADGMTLLADTMTAVNGGYGFAVTDSFTQQGSLVVDVKNQTISQRSVKLLVVKNAAGTIDLSKISVVNNPNEGYELKLTQNDESQILELVNPNVQSTLNVADQKTRFVKVMSLDYGQTFDPAAYEVTGATEEGGYCYVTKVENGVKVVYLENLMCYDYKQYDVYQATSDYHSTNALGQAVSSFTDGQNWSDKKAPHSDATYSMRDWVALHINTSGVYTFGGKMLNVASQSIPHHETIFRCDPTSTITVDDLRFQEGTGFFSSCGNGGSITFNGKMSLYGSATYPCYFKFNNNVRCIINSMIVGGATRFCSSQTAAVAGSRTFTLEFMGDTTGYAGTLQAQTNAVICLGPYGLTNGTVDVASCYSGVASYDPSKPAVVKALKLADGATIACTNSVYGLQTSSLEISGTVKLVFGAAPIARAISVLTVPSSVDLSTANFTVVKPAEGYVLKLEETDGYKTLAYVYEKTVTVGGLSATVNADYSCTISGEGELSSAASALREEGIKELTLGEGVTGVASGALSKFYALTKVTFKNTGKVTVADNAFLRCNSLESIAFEGEVPDLSEKAFTLQSAIYMKGGIPTIESIPAVTVQGYTRVIKASNDLTNWTTITAGTTDYHFFKVVYEKQ